MSLLASQHTLQLSQFLTEALHTHVPAACCLLLPTVTPPGHYTSGGSTHICPDGSFRSDWLPAQQATACTSCGSGVQGDKSDRLMVYNLTTGATSLLPVMTTGGDCCECLAAAPAQHSTGQHQQNSAQQQHTHKAGTAVGVFKKRAGSNQTALRRPASACCLHNTPF
jgi:hypothetical protein